MTFTIPTWLLWTLGLMIGVPAIIALIGLAIFGFVAAWALAGARFK
jgi:hypothetical protein